MKSRGSGNQNHKIYRNPVKEKEQQRHFITYTEEQESAIRTFENDYKRDPKDLSFIRCDRKRQDRGLYGNDPAGGKGKAAGNRADSGDRIDLPDGDALYRTFGERVSIMNSRLSAGERYDQMMRAKKERLM